MSEEEWEESTFNGCLRTVFDGLRDSNVCTGWDDLPRHMHYTIFENVLFRDDPSLDDIRYHFDDYEIEEVTEDLLEKYRDNEAEISTEYLSQYLKDSFNKTYEDYLVDLYKEHSLNFLMTVETFEPYSCDYKQSIHWGAVESCGRVEFQDTELYKNFLNESLDYYCGAFAPPSPTDENAKAWYEAKNTFSESLENGLRHDDIKSLVVKGFDENVPFTEITNFINDSFKGIINEADRAEAINLLTTEDVKSIYALEFFKDIDDYETFLDICPSEIEHRTDWQHWDGLFESLHKAVENGRELPPIEREIPDEQQLTLPPKSEWAQYKSTDRGGR